MDEDKTKEYLVKVKIEGTLEIEVSFTDELPDTDPVSLREAVDEELEDEYDLFSLVKSYEVLKWSPEKGEHLKTNIKLKG